jgi:hypothetical protein
MPPTLPSRRFFAVAALGRGRWYWVVWPSLAELQAADEPLLHVVEGEAPTKAVAVERALEMAGSDATWIAARYAQQYRLNRAAGGAPAAAGTPAAVELVYRDAVDAATGQWRSVPHRVARKTARYVVVEQQPYAPTGLTGAWEDAARPTLRLDRRTLEREGYAFVAASADLAEGEQPLFYARPRHPSAIWPGGQRPECLVTLELTWPCTVAEVKQAYRRLVKVAHPDGGGDHDRFLALHAAYEQALRLCGA